VLHIGSRYKEISSAANSLDPLAVLRSSKLPAQVADMNIDDPIERSEFPAQNRLGQLLAGKNAARLTHEDFKQGKFNAGQMQRHVLQPGFAYGWIDAQITNNQRAGS